MKMLGSVLWVEMYKLLRSRRLYVMIALVLLTTSFITIQHKMAYEREQASFQEFSEKAKQDYERTLIQYQDNIHRLEAKQSLTEQEQAELAETRERLASAIQQGPPVFQNIANPAQAVYIVFLSDFGVHFILPIITTLVVGANLAIERSNGTLKLLLTQPVKRTDIFLGKWGVAVIFILVFLVLETLVGALLGGFVFGFAGWWEPADAIPGVMTLSTGMKTIEFVVWGTLYNGLGMILIATIALTLSVFIPSPIGILAGTMFASLFGMAASDFLQKYASLTLFRPFSHLNFTKHFYANPLFTLTESVIVLVVYITILLVIGLRTFQKKDLYV